MINYMIVSFYMLCQILLSIIVTTVNYEPPFFFLYSLFTGLFISAEKGLKKHCPAKCSQGSTHDNPSRTVFPLQDSWRQRRTDTRTDGDSQEGPGDEENDPNDLEGKAQGDEARDEGSDGDIGHVFFLGYGMDHAQVGHDGGKVVGR